MTRNLVTFVGASLVGSAAVLFGCTPADPPADATASAVGSALAENDAVIVRASAITPHGRLLVSPAVGFEDASADGDTKAFCFAGPIAAVCDLVASSHVAAASCEADPAADRVTARYALAGRSVVREIPRCGGAAPTGTFLVGATAERDAHGVAVSVALGFRDRPAGAVRSFCYVGVAGDVCALVAAGVGSDPSFGLEDCSADDDTVTATYHLGETEGADVIAPCDR
jgi:hypothetical protein